MKICISYLPEEEWTARQALAMLVHILRGARVRHKDAHPPRKQIYLTLKEPGDDR